MKPVTHQWDGKLLTKENLAKLEKFDVISLPDDLSKQTVWSAININPDMFEGMEFSIRRDRTTRTDTYKGKRYLMRIK